MTIETVVNDVKGRLEPVVAQAQDVAKASFEALKAANEVVVTGVQGLVKTQTEAAKDLFEAGKLSFEKAKIDGLKAVASNPIEYLPSKASIVSAYNDTVTLLSQTGEDLVKVFKTGYDTVSAKIVSPAAPKPAMKKRTRKTVAKKAAAA